jgi:LPPG:FO 2-phospho-L-lactate transferase
MVVVLAGGVGAARFLRGVVRVVAPEDVTVVGNTGDDIDIYGVHVCPDLDIVTYMLAGVFDEERGFGIIGDTHGVMDELAKSGADTWFALGDRDLGVCAGRTKLLGDGAELHRVAQGIAQHFGVRVRMLPMTDAPVHTVVETQQGEMHFQEYWVRHRANIPALSVRLEGVEAALPAPGVLDAIARADAVLLAPSNPVVSIGTILQVPGIREALVETRAPVVGVSPIVGGRVMRGMADKLLPVVGAEVSAPGVAALYVDFLDGFVVDEQDAARAAEVEALGMRVAVTNTVMDTPERAEALAKETLALAQAVRA